VCVCVCVCVCVLIPLSLAFLMNAIETPPFFSDPSGYQAWKRSRGEAALGVNLCAFDTILHQPIVNTPSSNADTDICRICRPELVRLRVLVRFWNIEGSYRKLIIVSHQCWHISVHVTRATSRRPVRTFVRYMVARDHDSANVGQALPI
jgi:hypothetical protein